MSGFSILILLAFSGSPSPVEVSNDLDAHPWRPAPAPGVAVESTSRVVPQPPAQATTPPQTKSTPKEATASGPWRLQLGALSSPEAANAEKSRLEKILGTGTVEIVLEGSVNKIRYGRFGSKDDAETARAALKSKGVDGFSVLRP
jgi:uncharacterized protein